MMETFAQSLRGLFILLPLLISVAGIIAAFAVAIAIWRGMKAHEKMADSMERIEEKIGKLIEQNQTQV